MKLDSSKSMKEWRLEQKLRLASIICSQLHFGDEDKRAVKFLILNIDNFKLLSRKESNETIIAALCFYCMKTQNSSLQIDSYNVLKDYGLTYNNYATIITHLANFYQKKCLNQFV